MKTKLAVWYMEKAWLKMGSLRNVRAFHKLFNAAYGLRKQEYLAKILALPARMSDYQQERAANIRYLLQLTTTIKGA
jgi:hypothetical protein